VAPPTCQPLWRPILKSTAARKLGDSTSPLEQESDNTKNNQTNKAVVAKRVKQLRDVRNNSPKEGNTSVPAKKDFDGNPKGNQQHRNFSYLT
ncbi:MAG: hypothetical protein ACYSX1_04830, partial [Planctomycetota bacterium]